MSVLYVKMEHYKNKKLLKQYSCTNTIRIYCVFIYWHPQAILGKKVQRPATVQPELLEELQGCSEETDDFKTVIGTTMCTDDFYEGEYIYFYPNLLHCL